LYCATAASYAASACAVRALRRPPSKIVCASAAPSEQTRAGASNS